jgi:hypothetical protein
MTKQLTDKELETYSRQIVLSDIGYDGQLKRKRQFTSTQPALMGFSLILKNNPQKTKNN